MNNAHTPNEALSQLLISYMAAKQQLVASVVAHHPEPGHITEDIESGNLTTQIIVADGWLRVVLLIAATGVPIEQPLLHFSVPILNTTEGLQ